MFNIHVASQSAGRIEDVDSLRATISNYLTTTTTTTVPLFIHMFQPSFV